jgi:hypothetical protein
MGHEVKGGLNGLKCRKLILSALEWFGMKKVGFGLTGMAWIEEVGFSLTGMAWNRGSRFWPDQNGLE